MNFKQFLIEKVKNPKLFSEVTYQSLLTNLDYAHIDYTNDKCVFSVGKVIKDTRLDGLYVIIRKSDKDKVSYGNYSTKDGNVIVIDTTKYPKRAEIDSFLSSDTVLHKKILKVMEKHAEKVDGSVDPKNDNELKTHFTDKKNFEKAYDELLVSLDKLKHHYNQALKELDGEMSRSTNYSKRLEHTQAAEYVRQDYFGKTAKEFISKLSNTDSGKFINHLEKELKNTVVSRLTNYWESLTTS